jgi:hypothetical protein
MELATEPDIYIPSIDDNGNYVDKTPSFNNLKNGIRCPCGSRKDKTYDNITYFNAHIKTKTHKKWLEDINLNKKNYHAENIKLKEIIGNQKLIIAQLEKEVSLKLKTIDYLTQQLITKDNINNISETVTNLLDFD